MRRFRLACSFFFHSVVLILTSFGSCISFSIVKIKIYGMFECFMRSQGTLHLIPSHSKWKWDTHYADTGDAHALRWGDGNGEWNVVENMRWRLCEFSERMRLFELNWTWIRAHKNAFIDFYSQLIGIIKQFIAFAHECLPCRIFFCARTNRITHPLLRLIDLGRLITTIKSN